MIPTFLPSLEHMAAVRAAVGFHMDVDIQRLQGLHRNYLLGNLSDAWETIKTAVKQELVYFPVPVQIIVSDLLEPLHNELQDWMKKHRYIVNYNNYNTYKHLIHWSSEGTINRIQTAVNIIGNERIRRQDRYIMACMYFQEEQISRLWQRWEDTYGQRLEGNYELRLEGFIPARLENYDNLVTRFWEVWVATDARVPWTPLFEEHFRISNILLSDKPIRVSSFFHLLPRANRLDYFNHMRAKDIDRDDLRRSMYQMDEEEIIEFFRRNPLEMLSVFLDWPLQTLFMETANRLWNYLDAQSFKTVLYLIIFKYRYLRYVEYLRLFKEFWNASPNSHKEEFNDTDYFNIIEKVLHFDENSIYRYLNEIPAPVLIISMGILEFVL